jgi:NADPH2 dehydrogenase
VSASTPERIPKVRRLRQVADVRAHLERIGADLALDDEIDVGATAPLAQPCETPVRTLGNRFAILPMEGWDAGTEGEVTDLVRRRWQRFGQSGAKLVWGGEAVAVRQDGRANPRQLVSSDATTEGLAGLRELLVEEHERHHGRTDDLLVGLQLTHSGRWARPSGSPAPRIAMRNPILDARLGITSDAPLFADDALDELVEDFADAAVRAADAGFEFVDIKHCHGYLLHELLSAVDRPGRYGGSFENRTRFLRATVERIRERAPGFALGVRLSVFDLVPYRPGADRRGEPEDVPAAGWHYAFGGDGTGTGISLEEPHRFLELLHDLGIRLLCTTAGSPYYNPHVQRPTYFPPSDGYLPPEDPLHGVARQLSATAELKRAHPEMVIVGSGYSYLQDWLGHVAQRAVRDGLVDIVGIGRMALSYPTLPADVLAGRPLARELICRTFSDCTTAPRNGLISGCYPIDDFYKALPEADQLRQFKAAARGRD